MDRFNVGDKVRVKEYRHDLNSHYSNDGIGRRGLNMPRLVGRDVCIIDLSDGHGLTYRVVGLNYDGWRGRSNDIVACWVEPEELEAVKPTAGLGQVNASSD